MSITTLDYGAPVLGGAPPLNTQQKIRSTTTGKLPLFEINTASASAVSRVAASASAVTLLAANADRVGVSVYNDSGARLYLKEGSGASATSFTVPLDPGDLYEFPLPIYVGLVSGIWVTATGAAQLTERTST